MECKVPVCIINWFSSDPAWTWWAGFALMGFLELTFKLLVAPKSTHKGGCGAELQTWPSLMSQPRKSLLNLLSVSRDTSLLLCGRYEDDTDFCAYQSLSWERLLPFSSFCVVRLFSCYIYSTGEMCRMQTFMQKIHPLSWICSIIGSYLWNLCVCEISVGMYLFQIDFFDILGWPCTGCLFINFKLKAFVPLFSR